MSTYEDEVRRVADEVHERYGIGGTVRRIIRDFGKEQKSRGREASLREIARLRNQLAQEREQRSARIVQAQRVAAVEAWDECFAAADLEVQNLFGGVPLTPLDNPYRDEVA